MIFKAKTQKILIDSNIIRRLLEEKVSVCNYMNKLLKDGKTFYISDMSLFELFSNTSLDKTRILELLLIYEITPFYKNIIPEFRDEYFKWFSSDISINLINKQLYSSFEYSMVHFIDNIIKATICILANSLETDYSSEFYSYIQIQLNNIDTKSILKSAIEESYIYNKTKFENLIKMELKELVLRELCYYLLLQDKTIFDESEFNLIYDELKNKYSDKEFYQICYEYIKKDSIIIDDSSIENEMDRIFIKEIIIDILTNNNSLHINDLTDFINFKYSIEFNCIYYTYDEKSLKKYKRLFHNTQYISHVENSCLFQKQFPI